MAHENVEIVRRYVEAQNGTPEEVAAAARALWDVDGGYYPVRKFPEARPCHGLEEIAAFIVRFREAWSVMPSYSRISSRWAMIAFWSAQSCDSPDAEAG